MHDIQERFSNLDKPSYYVKADINHVLDWYIGLDEQGFKSIKLRAKFTVKSVKGTSSIIVKQYKHDDYNTLVFSLADDEISGLFYKFCDDLIELSRKIEEPILGYQIVTNRYIQWKKMFLNAKSEFLSEIEIMGLIGEILFLRDSLFEEYGQHQALASWSGQELTHKDFSNQDTWYEVKAISRGKQSVKISSIEQLESDKIGKLIVYTLEKMSSVYNGIRLNKLIYDVYESLSNEEDKGDFISKVSLQGFSYNDYYDNYVYELCDCTQFLVELDFPRITRDKISSAIVKAQYELSLLEINNYKIG